MQTDQLLDRWDIRSAADTVWTAWGQGSRARAEVLGEADGYTVTVIEAEAGYRGAAHEHTSAEFFYLVEGRVRNQGRTMQGGDGYAAAAGSVHSDFEVLAPSTYLIVWRL
jgi:quercetin dioxygenase-like cupin family protein